MAEAEFRRPKLTNDEDEILEIQRRFLAGKIPKAPEMQVVSGSNRNIEADQEMKELKKKSVFAARMEGKGCQAGLLEPQEVEFTQVAVLSDVVERIPHLTSGPQASSFSSSSFPEVFSCSPKLPTQGTGSIFSRTVAAKKARKTQPDPDESMEDLPTKSSRPQESTVKAEEFQTCSLLGSGAVGRSEAEQIHTENVRKLSAMTTEQILKEREELLGVLGPEMVAFVRDRAARIVVPPGNLARVPSAMVEDESRPEETSEPLPEQLAELRNPNWVHMDVVEKDKLAWMTPAPVLGKPGNEEQPFAARFDFEGVLLSYDAQPPTTSALYHHGDEPHRAGYTVSELLILSRSQVLQQRVLSLRTLARVLERQQRGEYDGCFEQPLSEHLLDHGLLLMLRHSLDDSNAAVVGAALDALTHLLTNSVDETALERCLQWHRGLEQPALPSRQPIDEGDPQQLDEMADDQLARIDVVKACLRIDLLVRIRYIVETMRPEAGALLSAASILTRLARHSADAAVAIVNCPRLVAALVASHLAASRCTSPEEGAVARKVLCLLRTVASWNATLARRLEGEHQMTDALVSLLAVEATVEFQSTADWNLVVASALHAWRALLYHGVGVDAFTGAFPLLIRELLFVQHNVSVDPDDIATATGATSRKRLGTALLLMVESALALCCSGVSADSGGLHFVHVAAFRVPVETCLRKWMHQMCAVEDASKIDQWSRDLVAAGLHLTATFYAHWNDDAKALPALNELCIAGLVPLLRCRSLSALAAATVGHSNLLSQLQSSNRDPCTLPAVQTVTRGGQPAPLLLAAAPFALLAALLRLLRLWKNRRGSVASDHVQVAGDWFWTPLFDYLEKLGNSGGSSSGGGLTDNWFTRYEIHFVYELLMLASDSMATGSALRSTLHTAALVTLEAVPVGDEFIAGQLLRRIVFNQIFAGDDPSDLEAALKRLDITEPAHRALLDKAIHRLPDTAAFYIGRLLGGAATVSTPRRLVVPAERLLPSDWLYLPLLDVYRRFLDAPSQAMPDGQRSVVRPLEAAYVLLTIQPRCFFRIDAAEHYCRLACTFLAANDMFLDPDVAGYLRPLLRGLAGRPANFMRPIRGVDDFPAFYSQLLEQFEAVSYGDRLFGAFLLLPAQQSQDVRLRTALWCQHETAVGLLHVAERELPAPLQRWLEPAECDSVLLNKYRAAISSGAVRPDRNPVLWRIARHHTAT